MNSFLRILLLSIVAGMATTSHAFSIKTMYGSNQSVPVGSNALLEVILNNPQGAIYQWQFKQFDEETSSYRDIEGATNSVYRISNAQPSNEGVYRVLIGDPLNEQGVEFGFYVITDPTRIANLPTYSSVSPTDFSISPQGAVVFKINNLVSAGNTFYQWHLNDKVIESATQNVYQIPSATPAHAGNYTVSIKNAHGTVYSTPSTLTIGSNTAIPPQIEIQPPATINALIGGGINVPVAVSGDAPLTYQWHKNNVPYLSTLTPTMAINSSSYADQGTYRLVVSSPHGTAQSNVTTVNLGEPPNFTSYPLYRYFRYASSPMTLSAPATQINDPAAPVYYSWLQNNQTLAGGSQATINLQPLNFSSSIFNTITYNTHHSLHGPNIMVNTIPEASPMITGVSGLLTYQSGDTISLKATAMGNVQSYQWRRSSDGMLLSTTDTLTIPNAQTTHSATYTVVAVNSAYPSGQFEGTVHSVVTVLPKVKTRVTEKNVAVIVNRQDPYSVAVGAYYQKARAIPSQNMIYVDTPVKETLTQAEFEALRATINQRLTNDMQVLAVAWKFPARVNCNSFSAALTRGYDAAMCNDTCGIGGFATNPLYQSTSTTPFTTHGIRPAMMLAAHTEAQARAMIDRGKAASGTFPNADAYVMITPDVARSLRGRNLRDTRVDLTGYRDHPRINTRIEVGYALSNRSNIIAYFTGLTHVPNLHTNQYLPGAVGDHLTSHGGLFSASNQMTILDFIANGLTGSYGTVSEPCANQSKFPEARIFLRHYGNGDTLVEAYWKSVARPSLGQFVGDPLATPYRQKPATFGFQRPRLQ
jgi:uncharacterized protein (TIGR03790 family)